tara:strand:- start:50 stop:388 length:339 start_codon:yes stop_codon:yes gene_type:complete
VPVLKREIKISRVRRHEKPRFAISLQFSLMMNKPSEFNFCSVALPSQVASDTASMLTRPLLLELAMYDWREQSEPAQMCERGRIGKPLNQRDQSFLQTVLHPDSVAPASAIS